MKVLMITGTFPPRSFGGVTAVSFSLAKNLVQLGHEVTVYTTDTGNDKNNRLNVIKTAIIDKINITYFKNLNNSIAFTHRIYIPIGYFSKIKKTIRDFDIIHIHDYRSLLCLICCYYAKKYQIPYIIQTNGDLSILDKNIMKLNLVDRFKNKLKIIFDRFYGNIILKNASKLIAVTDFERIQYEFFDVDKKNIIVLPNGLNISEFENLPDQNEFRKKFEINKDDKIILYLGRINMIKGLGFLLKTFNEIIIKNKNCKLVIAGPDDGYLSNLQDLINELNLLNYVLFTGLVVGTEKLRTFVDADILVYPSKYEIFGLVPFEAIMCGTPAIVTDTCGCGEMVKKANCGYVVNYGNNFELKTKICDLIAHPDIGEKMVENGKRYIINNLDWQIIAKNLVNIYIEILEKSK